MSFFKFIFKTDIWNKANLNYYRFNYMFIFLLNFNIDGNQMLPGNRN